MFWVGWRSQSDRAEDMMMRGGGSSTLPRLLAAVALLLLASPAWAVYEYYMAARLYAYIGKWVPVKRTRTG